jgi:hypothetical protein
MMDMDAEIIAEPFRPLIGIVEEVPEEIAPRNCKIITVKKGGETMQFCVPAEGEK